MKLIALLVPILMAGSSVSTGDGFDFGDCSGSGAFEQQIDAFNGNTDEAVTVGTIPAGLQGLRISLQADSDIDIRLFGSNNEKLVHWPGGLLNGASAETESYKEAAITYSGYGGVDGDKGHEYIEVEGSTPETMTIKAFGYEAGLANVNYSWTGKDHCQKAQLGDGSFTQAIQLNQTTLVGTIPASIANVEVNLQAVNDIDIQLFGADGTPIVAWPSGLLAGADSATVNYHGMSIEWSGYSGVNGDSGHEFIRVVGNTSEALTMKVYGYSAGTAQVTYSWGAPLAEKNYPATTTLMARATDLNLVAPNVDQYVNDNVFGTKITRVDKADTALSNYPKVQSWNQDMSLLRIGHRIYDAGTLKETPITSGKTGSQAYATLCSRASDYFRWSSLDPDVFFVLNSNYEFVRGEITGNSVSCSNVLDSFADFEIVHMGPHEGNIDTSDKYVVFAAKKPNDSAIYVVLFDIPSMTRVWTKQLPNDTWEWIQDQNFPNDPTKGYWAPVKLDWLSMSQSGTYIVQNNNNGVHDGMYRYNRDFLDKTQLQYRWDGDGQLYSEGGHGDIGYDSDGNEVFVQFIGGVGVYSFNLDNPTELGKELLSSPYGGGHISCRNTDRSDGWCYVTTKGDDYLRVFALKIDGTGNETVQNFAQTHVGGEYQTVYGSPNPDGTKVIFNSYWANADHSIIDTYIAEAQ